MNNLVTLRSSVSPAVLLAFASALAAQNSQSLEQRVADIEARLQSASSVSGSSSRISEALSGAELSYTPGRGLTLSAQDAESFSVNIGGQIQAGWAYSDDDPTMVTNSGFAVRDARVRLGGNVVSDKITYFIQMDPAAGVDLVDAWVGWRFADSINLRVGQQKMRSSLQADTSMNDTDLEFVDRSIATVSFAGQRATGALLEGHAVDGRLNWHAGLMNNGTAGIDAAGTVPGSAAALVANAVQAGTGQQAGRDELGWTVGASYGSCDANSEDWSEGDLARNGKVCWIAGVTVTQANESAGTAGDATTVNAFAGFKSGNGIAVQGEFFSRNNDTLNRDDTGFYIQGSYTLAKTGKVQWAPSIRYSMVDFDGPEADEIAVGINAYYQGHDLKTQVQFRQIGFDNAAGTEVSDTQFIDVLFTLVF